MRAYQRYAFDCLFLPLVGDSKDFLHFFFERFCWQFFVSWIYCLQFCSEKVLQSSTRHAMSGFLRIRTSVLENCRFTACAVDCTIECNENINVKYEFQVHSSTWPQMKLFYVTIRFTNVYSSGIFVLIVNSKNENDVGKLRESKIKLNRKKREKEREKITPNLFHVTHRVTIRFNCGFLPPR